MAKVLSTISFTLSSDDDGDLNLSSGRIQYSVKDSVDTDLRKGGNLMADAIVGSDTVLAWWAKVKTQIETAESI